MNVFMKYYYKTIYYDVDKTALFSWPHVDNLIINKIDENNMLTSIIATLLFKIATI